MEKKPRNNGRKSLIDNRLKDTRIPQKLRVLLALSSTINPLTMLMVAKRTDIERANICRYFRVLKRGGKIEFVKFGLCHVTKNRAGFYTATKYGRLYK